MAATIQVLTALGAVAAAIVLGGMIGFAGLAARLILIHLPDETSKPLMRQMYPVYNKFMLGAAVVAALLLLPTGRYIDAGLMALVAIGFGFANWWFLPQANHLADTRSPDVPQSEVAFMSIQMRAARLGLLKLGLTIAVVTRLAL